MHTSPAEGPTDGMPFDVRPYTDEDESGVGETLQAAFGRWPGDIDVSDPVAYFRWKHLESPHGRSLMLVAEADSRVIGFVGWMPCVFTVGGRQVHALRGVDLAVRPEFRGQRVAAALATAGAQHFPPETSFSLSNPNAMSKGTVLRQGRRPVGRFPTFVRLRRPIRTVRGRRSPQGDGRPPPSVDAETTATALADTAAVASLLAQVEQPEGRLTVAKDIDFLRWRYGALDHYRAIRAERGRELRGLSIFRVRRHGATWNTRICELFVAGHDRGIARRLLRATVRAARVDYATCHFPPGSVQRRAAIQSGFIQSRYGETVLAFKFDPSLTPDPTQPGAWALTLGDLDLL